jgi:hypothetical protein
LFRPDNDGDPSAEALAKAEAGISKGYVIAVGGSQGGKDPLEARRQL